MTAERSHQASSEDAVEVAAEELFEAMEGLSVFTEGATFKWENQYYALIYATIVRSSNTFAGVCMSLRQGLPVQAAMLARTLFEDVLVAHWLVLNEDDHDWLVDRFIRHREAIALHQRKLQKETHWAMGLPLSAPNDLQARQNELQKEFGAEAKKNWWDPGQEGRGKGKPVGLREIARRLEASAATRERFHPRFAGGEEPLLEGMELVVNKWLSQFIHHTAIGLPFAPVSEDSTEAPSDPTLMVAFNASWLFAQQVYLIHEINHVGYERIDAAWFHCLALFQAVYLGPEAAEDLLGKWEEHYGHAQQE